MSDARRVASLDVVRGLAVAGMILVNNPGDWGAVMPPLTHAYWTGVTAADFVFPAFIFVAGVAIPFAFARRRAAGASTRDVYRRVGFRVLTLIAFGLALNAVSAWSDAAPLRFPGVLQRIALAYLVAGVVVLNVRGSLWLVVAAVLLAVHWALLALLPFGGQPAGTMTPEHNLARFVDTVVFGRHALAIPVDPEGLLGTLTASATAVLGATVGELIRRRRGDRAPVRVLVPGGVIALGAGLIWSRALPLSKPLWTGSFVLVTAGVTTIAFALIYFVVDVLRFHRWSGPLMWLGVRPLTIYVGSEIVRRLLDAAVVPRGSGRTTPKAWLFWDVLQPAFGPWPPELASFAFAVGVLGMWIALAAAVERGKR